MKLELLSDEQKEQFRHLFTPLVDLIVKWNIHPNVLTSISFLLCIVAAVYYVQGNIISAGFIFLFGGLFDMIDGAVARAANRASLFGAFYDSVLDRYAEIIIFGGIAIHFYANHVFHPVVKAMALIAIFLAVTGSLMVSYTRARAEGLHLDCKVGLLQRPERILILALSSIISNFVLFISIVAIAILANYTAIQRILHVYNSSKRPPHGL